MTPEQEWRAFLVAELREIKEDIKTIHSEMTTLKLKVAGISAIISSILTYVMKGNS